MSPFSENHKRFSSRLFWTPRVKHQKCINDDVKSIFDCIKCCQCTQRMSIFTSLGKKSKISKFQITFIINHCMAMIKLNMNSEVLVCRYFDSSQSYVMSNSRLLSTSPFLFQFLDSKLMQKQITEMLDVEGSGDRSE